MPNESTPVTTNYSIEKPGDPTLNEVPFSFNRINTGMDTLDTALDAIATDISDLDTSTSTAIDDLGNLKKDLETLVTTTNMTYDGSDRLTLYEDASYKFYNPIYSGNKLTQYDEDIKLAGTSYQVTLTYTGDLITSITRSTL